MTSREKVIVVGAGIAGLCAAYELTQDGFDVSVLEAADRSGGHIMTVRDRLADGLYADAGAEHFYERGYNLLWSYVQKFRLPVVPYPRRHDLTRTIEGRAYSEKQLHDPKVLKEFGFNEPEVEFLSRRDWSTLATGLYYARFTDNFKNEYNPFDVGLNHLDSIGTRALLLQLGASERAAGFFGGLEQSALQAVWHAAIRAKRGMALFETELFRVRGGNHQIIEALTAGLREPVRLSCPITTVEQRPDGIRVHYRERDQNRVMDADRLVSGLPLSRWRGIPVTPDWTAAKRYIIDNIPYDTHSRVIFQSRTRFWETDGLSPNMDLGDVSLSGVWASSDEVDTKRGLLLGTIATGTPLGECAPEKALAAFRRHYRGKSEDIERCQVIPWSKKPVMTSCLPVGVAPGELPKYWPEVMRPHGRIHFAGVYADNLPFGMEAGIRSALRVVREIKSPKEAAFEMDAVLP